MKQNMKKALLVLCMAVCFLTLSACSADSGNPEPVPQQTKETMISGAEGYLREFAAFDAKRLQSELEDAQWRKNTVMETALTAWQTSMTELGGLVSIDTAGAVVTRLDKHSFEVTMEAQFEKRPLTFTLTAEEQPVGNSLVSGPILVPTDLLFVPYYTTGEKLAKAGMNTLMGMGTVFLVLIFISLIIGSFKNINKLEASMAAKKQANVPAPAPVSAPAAAVSEPEPADTLASAEPVWDIPLPGEENLAADTELVAVITAAIAAAASVPAEGLVVRSIRRRPGSKWKNA